MWQGVDAHVGSLVNDSTATLAAARYLDGPNTVGAVIMGTGEGNACFHTRPLLCADVVCTDAALRDW